MLQTLPATIYATDCFSASAGPLLIRLYRFAHPPPPPNHPLPLPQPENVVGIMLIIVFLRRHRGELSLGGSAIRVVELDARFPSAFRVSFIGYAPCRPIWVWCSSEDTGMGRDTDEWKGRRDEYKRQ